MMKKKSLFGALVAVGLVFGAGSAMAADGAQLYQSKTCMSCHGANGEAPITPMYPKIGGQNAAYLIQQMKDIKSGARNNGQTAAMKGIMAAVSDEEIEAIANWLATL